jgi:RND family efflux transporter MFP subunit
MKNKRLRSFLTITGILALGVVIFNVLIAFRPTPPRTERPKVIPLVTTVQPEAKSGVLTIQGNGTVRATREINLVAEVAGKVVSVAASAVSGGFIQQGATLISIDPSDYENAVAVARAEVTQRRYELLLAREEVSIAREEWGRLQRRREESEDPAESELGSLVLKEPQLKLAESLLESAEARLADAQTRLQRTNINAPFNGRVRSKQVDIGQYVSPGQAVATVYNTDEVEIAVPMQSAEASLIGGLWERDMNRRIDIPVRVFSAFGKVTHEWKGYVDRTEGTLDAATRTVNVVVRVPAPYEEGPASLPPLLVGMFTTVEIEGQEMETYFIVPRPALKENETVWVYANGRLEIRPVEIIQEQEGRVYIADGLAPGDRLITSNLEVFTDGMEVRETE